MPRFTTFQAIVSDAEKAAAHAATGSVSGNFQNVFTQPLINPGDPDSLDSSRKFTGTARGWLCLLALEDDQLGHIKTALAGAGLISYRYQEVLTEYVPDRMLPHENPEVLCSDGGWRIPGRPMAQRPTAPALDLIGQDGATWWDANFTSNYNNVSIWDTVQHSSIVWFGAGILRGWIWGYEGRLQERDLQAGLEMAENIMQNRDDQDGGQNGQPDFIRGNQWYPAYSSDRYSPNSAYWTTWIPHSGNVMGEIGRVAWLVLRDRTEPSWRQRAEALRDLIPICLEAYDNEYTDDFPIAGHGDYRDANHATSSPTPANMQLLMGYGWLNYWKLTGSQKALSIATKLFQRQKDNQTIEPPNGTVWGYRFADTYPQGRVEDFGHGSVISKLHYEGYQSGLVFNRQDNDWMNDRFRWIFEDPSTGWYNYIDRTNFNPQNSNLTEPFAQNGQGPYYGQSTLWDPVSRGNIHSIWQFNNWNLGSRSSNMMAAGVLMKTTTNAQFQSEAR